MRLVRVGIVAACAAGTLLAGCSGDDGPAEKRSGPSTTNSFPKTTPDSNPSTGSSTTGGTPAPESESNAAGGGSNGGTGSAARELAFSLVRKPGPCGPETVRELNGDTCYLLGEQLLSAPLLSNVAAERSQSNPGTYDVRFTLFSKYKDAFLQITKKNVGKQLAITFEGKVLSAPVINGPIPGGAVSIAGNFTKKQATDLAARLGG